MNPWTTDSTLVAPINRLPPEILHQIFFNVVEPHEVIRLAPSKLPWIISHVCQSWRYQALSLSSLWAQITIHFWQSPSILSSMFRRAKVLLKRSRRSFLYVYLDLIPPSATSLLQVNALLQHSHRWRGLYIRCSPSSAISALRSIQGHIQSLVSLDIHVMEGADSLTFQTDRTFQDAPQLRHVAIRGSTYFDFSLPFRILSSYKDMRGCSRGPQIALNTSHNLVRLQFQCGSADPADFLPIASAPSLISLKILFGNESASSTKLFDKVTFPSLKEFIVVNPRPGLLHSFTKMIASLTTSSPGKLKHLSILNAQLEPGELTNLLSETPLLRSLRTTIPPLDDLQHLPIRPDTIPLVPLLKKLVIEVGEAELPCNMIYDIARTRCGHGNDANSSRPNIPHRPILKNFTICYSSKRVCLDQLETLYPIFAPNVAVPSRGRRDSLVQLGLDLAHFYESLDPTSQPSLINTMTVNAWFNRFSVKTGNRIRNFGDLLVSFPFFLVAEEHVLITYVHLDQWFAP